MKCAEGPLRVRLGTLAGPARPPPNPNSNPYPNQALKYPKFILGKSRLRNDGTGWMKGCDTTLQHCNMP